MSQYSASVLVVVLLFIFGPFGVNSSDNGIEIEKSGLRPVLLLIDMKAPENHLPQIKDIIRTVTELSETIILKFPGTPAITVDRNTDINDVVLNNTTALPGQEFTEMLEQADISSHVLMLSDRYLDETVDIGYISNIIQNNQLQIDFLDYQKSGSLGSRTRRQATSSCGTNIYQCIAQQSGGTVITTDKDHVISVDNLLKQSLKAQTVNIKRFTYSSPMMSKFKFPVDDTMSEVAILIRVMNRTKAPVALPYQPTGIPAVGKQQILGQNMDLMEYNITNANQFGLWQIQKLDMETWDVTITAQSPVDLTYQFLEPGPGGYGEYPIQGRPIAGKTVKLMVTVPQYENITGVSTVFFEDEFYNVFDVLNLKNVGGRYGKSMFYTQITVPTKMFRIAIQGVDKSGHQFRRLQLAYKIPVSFKLFVPSFTGMTLYTNETLRIPFTVENTGSKKQDIYVEISDDKSFAQFPLRVSASIDPGKNFSGNFTILGGTVIGETTTLTITAKPYVRGHITHAQFEVRRLTVEERSTQSRDPFPPSCSVIKVTGLCDIGSDLCQCVNKRWSMEVEVSDVGFGLRDVFPTSVGSTHKFTATPFTTPGYNTSVGVVKATLEDDCCHQSASVSAVDMSGQITPCFLNITNNFIPPDMNICNHTSPLNITVSPKAIKTIGSCTQIFPCDCHNKTWRLQVEFDKVNSNNLFQAFTIGAGHNSTMTYVNSQTVEVETDCCHRDVAVSATDVAGNIGQVNVTMTNYTDCAVPTSPAITTQSATRPTTAPVKSSPFLLFTLPVVKNTRNALPSVNTATLMRPTISSSMTNTARIPYAQIITSKSSMKPVILPSVPTAAVTPPPSTTTAKPVANVTVNKNITSNKTGNSSTAIACSGGSVIDLQIKIQLDLHDRGRNP